MALLYKLNEGSNSRFTIIYLRIEKSNQEVLIKVI
jgi:hypothetical protein